MGEIVRCKFIGSSVPERHGDVTGAVARRQRGPEMTDAAAASVEAFRLAFCRERGSDPAARFDVFAFGDDPAMADELLGCVLRGPERATAGLVLDDEAAGDPLPEAGAYAVVLDGAGRPRCVLRTTEVRVMPFRDVDAAFAWDEGDGDRSLAW
jgi:uncharacterized protein YhfF